MVTKKRPNLSFKIFTEDWGIYKLEDLTEKISDGIHTTPQYSEDGEYYFINGNNLSNGKIIITETTKRVDSNEYNKLKVHINSNTILLSINGTIGNIAYYGGEPVLLGKSAAYLNLKSKHNKSFVYYSLQSPSVKSFFNSELTGSTIMNLSLTTIKKTKIGLPSLEEQTKIATFLSAVDSKITSLERLVSHWQAYKKGIMQQIFTQQLRFKAPNGEDFPEWETKTLGEIGSTYNGLSGKTKDDFGSGFPYITYKSVFDNSRVDINRVEYVKVFISSNVEDKSEKQNKVEYGDIFFTVSSETPTEVGMSSVLLDEIDNCYLNSFCFGYRLNDKVSFNPKFFQHYLRSSEMRKCISILAQGSTRYNISASNMMNLEIIVPSSEEQTKIATFLSSLDDKIAHLQQQLTSYRQFKKALLQQMFV